jgi:hypothetical protein
MIPVRTVIFITKIKNADKRSMVSTGISNTPARLERIVSIWVGEMKASYAQMEVKTTIPAVIARVKKYLIERGNINIRKVEKRKRIKVNALMKNV